jgi:hypothetical protein
MKSQKEGGFGPPRDVTPWKKKKIMQMTIIKVSSCLHNYIWQVTSAL